ncbi:LuxR C-terminal-related transcriptional regulator [Xanthomonas massiliensis]|uniref:LuxR C-terminal-related transcriptional regulator n=1 Tax=Xanthomonas massiliensis TaxID=1720302 RepID=UPI000826EA91|nr:LuxR C-terminal-related transcriptional regulator [Xanthomonas massiliensis]
MFKNVALLSPRTALAATPLAVDWLLATKLDPPPQRITAVSRTTLLGRLDEGLALPLTLLLAPPGYGKTTTLAQWFARLRQREDLLTVWLSLDEDDAEPATLAAYLTAGLVSAGLEPTPALLALLRPAADIGAAELAGTLINAMRGAGRRIALVLDDYDRAQCPATDELLSRLIVHAGNHLHLLLATRRAPALPLARLSVHGNLLRLGPADLAMDEAEAGQLLGPRTSPEVVRQVRQRTEGWAVALHLASLWAADDDRRQDEIARFSGRSAGIAAYLTEQVVDGLDQELRRFLLHTCLLARFDTALANAMRGRGDSGELMTRLGHFMGLLIPLDGEHEWFRYHPLFAEYLQQRLEHKEPAIIPQLHRRAAHWLDVHGDVGEAVRHACLAGDIALAADIVARAGGWQLLLDHVPSQVRGLMRHFPPAAVRDTPVLNLTQAYLHMKLGEFAPARTLLERFRHFDANERAACERDYTIVAALLRDLLDEICAKPHGTSQVVAQAEALDAGDAIGRGTLLCIAASSALGRGQFAQATELAGHGQAWMQQAGNAIGVGWALTQLGQACFYRGELDHAETLYRQALAVADHRQGAGAVLAACGRCLLARLQCERGRYDEAADLLEPALAFLQRHDGWLDVFVAGYETALALARQRDRSGRTALALLDEVDAFAHRRHLTRLADLAGAWRVHVALELPEHPAVDTLVARCGGEEAWQYALDHAHGWRTAAALGFALADWHARAGRSQQALQLLYAIEQQALARDDRHHLVRARARLALVLQQRGEADTSMAPLRQVLDQIATTLGWHAVAELGLPAKAMLRVARQNDPEIGAGTTRAYTVQALLDRLQDDEAAASELFSTREMEVLVELARGCANKQIARRLGLSENTVKFHLKNIYRKLEADSREAALAAAARQGLVRP